MLLFTIYPSLALPTLDSIISMPFFPDRNYGMLFQKITPVNTFRVVFNTYFGSEYPLLKDQSINVGINRPYGKKTMKPTACP